MSDFDPKLKEAMAEIQAVIKKYDLGAMIQLYSQSHAEFANIIDPSWSVLRWDQSQCHLRFRSKRCDYANPEEQRLSQEVTVNMIASIADLSARNFAIYDKILGDLKKHIDFEVSEPKITPHHQQ